ncbi:MAG: M48 family metallopeptidase [Ignavibacteria bacterium]
MKNSKSVVFSLLILLLFLSQCNTVPITGRRQLSLVSDSEMLTMSFQQYGDFVKSHKLSTSVQQTEMVKRVGSRVQRAVEQYCAQNKLSGILGGYSWEFNLVEDPQVNAWCMPGGKVVVYSGILPVTQDESGLAVVLGHEIAHAVAKHGDERMSQGLLEQLGGVALSEAIKSKPAVTQQIYKTAFGLGAQVGVMLPFSRTQESEADHLGIIFMSMAGYNPNVAVTFWQRMAASNKGAAPLEFLSDHPSDAKRINEIKSQIPEAMKYFKK